MSEGVKTGSSASGQGLVELAVQALNADPEREAIHYRNRWFTYGYLRTIAERLLELIEQTGADLRAPVAFAPQNRPEVVAALLGLIAGARNIRMVYAYQSGASMARTLERTNASIFLAVAEDFSPEIIEQLRTAGCAGIGLTENSADFIAGLDRVTRETDPNAAEVPTLEILTSGTTGPAKLYPLTYQRIEERYINRNIAFARDRPKDLTPFLNFYPLANVSGLYGVLPTLLVGTPVVLQDKFSVEGWRDFVVRYRPKDIYLPPAGIKMVLDANVPPEVVSGAKLLRSGMTHLPPEVQRAFEDRYKVPILLTYGATEFGGVVVQMTEQLAAEWGQRKLGSVGRAFGESMVRVVDPQTGKVLPAGKEGLLEVLVPSISPHWNRTTDIALIDQDEFVFILGRADGAIQRGGFKILPEIVESALVQHPGVKAAAVIGMKDERLGEVPAALIERKEDANGLSAEDLEKHLRAHLPSTHIPAVWRFVDQIPRTISMKVSLIEVRKLLQTENAN
jgi:long-chain acyl-CoA synthetase